jgi:hypothetical protein
VAELMLDKQMLQEIAKKNGESRSAAGRGGLAPRDVQGLGTSSGAGHRAVAVDASISSQEAAGRASFGPSDHPFGTTVRSLRLPTYSCDVDSQRVYAELEAGGSTLDRVGTEETVAPEEIQEKRTEAGRRSERLQSSAVAIQERCVDMRLYS